jgi:hypothetical protein
MIYAIRNEVPEVHYLEVARTSAYVCCNRCVSRVSPRGRAHGAFGNFRIGTAL